MKNKIFIVLLLGIATIAGLTYAMSGDIVSLDTARYSVPKKNFRALTSAVYKNISATLVFDEKAEELKELKNLAEQGDLKAQCWLGKSYFVEADKKKRNVDKLNEAVKWYVKAADQKSAEALDGLLKIAEKFNNQEAFECLLRNSDDFRTKRMVGQLYAKKNSKFYNKEEAKKCFDGIIDAADRGNSQAQYQLGIMYARGQGVENNPEKALYWYRKAAEQNNADALSTLGNIYKNGQLGVTKNTAEAFDFYLKAANLGHADAMSTLAYMYKDVSRDMHESAQWRVKSIKHGNDGVLSGMYSLFSQASNGDTEALAALIELGNDGYDEAQDYLGRIYDKKRDYKEAAKWYIKAYRLGYLNVLSSIERLYEMGVPETIEVFKDYAYDGNGRAQALLGWAYAQGFGVKKDYNEALKWLRKSSEQGNETGHYLLGRMYYNGLGVKQDYAEAAHLIGRAAFGDGPFSTGGMLSAMTAYNRDANIIYGRGLIYRDGLYETKPDKNRALGLFVEAAQKGSIEANFTLGDMYENGKDVVLDYNKAAEYYANAAKNDDQRSLVRLKSLAGSGNAIAKQKYDAIVNYVKTFIDANEFKSFLKICENGSLSNFKETYTKLKLSPNAIYRNDKEFIDENLLSLAVSQTSNVDIVKFLLSKGADVNSQSTGWRELGPESVYVSNMTALMKASICYSEGKPEIVKTLLDAGADVNVKDSGGMTALDWALETSTMFGDSNTKTAAKIIKMLLDAGADAKDSLDYAFLNQGVTPEILKMLLKAGANVNNDTLMLAVINTEYPDVIELLLDAGANPKAKSEMKDFKGMRPVEVARNNSNLQGTQALRRLEEESYDSPEEREREEAEKKAAQQAEFQKLLQKAEQGDVDAQSNIAFKYLLGMDGIEIDGEKAVYWFKKAAEQGDMGSTVKLSSLYKYGDDNARIKKNEKEAAFWSKKAEEAIRRHNGSKADAPTSKSPNNFQTNASITGDKVNIRIQPNTSSKVVKQLNTGHPVKATKQTKGKDGTWYFIQTASGTQGWVFGKYVKLK